MDSEEDKGHDCKFQDSDSEHEHSILSISQKATMQLKGLGCEYGFGGG